MSAVLGVDGGRGGWIGALVEDDRVSWVGLPDIAAALALDVAAVGVDMPIGLPDTGRRECDLLAKIREVDAHADDPRLVEVHPELSFAALAGRVLASKHSTTGLDERRRALQQWLPGLDEVPWGDDGLDALAAAWSATRWLAGSARSLPADPPTDRRGRPMRIVT